MSACAHPTANADLTSDPTNTLPTRRDFIADVERRARDLRGRIRRKIGYENDALHLMQSAPGGALTPNADDKDRFEFVTRQDLRRRFTEWLRAQIRDALSEPVSRARVRRGEHWTAPYIRSAYTTGWQQATGRLMQAGVSVQAAGSIDAIIQLPVPQQQLSDLYARAFENLDGITADMADTIRGTLTEGLAKGWNPRKTARKMNEDVDTVTNSRLRTLARTETINSHSTAMLDRYEEAGVDTVMHGEWATADDDRVCPICEALEGRECPIGEFRTGVFQFDADDEDVPDHLAGTYRLKPPAHPNGRCTILPVIV